MNWTLPDGYRGLIFDCDGTLTDSMPLHFIAWNQTMQKFGIEFPEDRFYALGGIPSDKIVQMLAKGLQLVMVMSCTRKLRMEKSTKMKILTSLRLRLTEKVLVRAE